MPVNCDKLLVSLPETPSLCQLLLQQVALRPNDDALWREDEGWLDWSTLAVMVSDVAEELLARGIRGGDRLVTQLPNSPLAITTSLASELLGAIESPQDVRTPWAEVRRRMDALQTKHLLRATDWELPSSPARRQSSGQERQRIQRFLTQRTSSPALRQPPASLILWTSGTTQESRGVLLSSVALIANATGKLGAVPQTPEVTRLTVLPLAHAYARTCDLVTWLVSGSRLAAGEGWEGIENFGPSVRPTHINLVPALIDRLLGVGMMETSAEAPQRARIQERLKRLGMAELRVIGCGGAPLTEGRFETLKKLGILPIQGYGLTEAGPVICSASIDDARPGRVGKPIAGTEVRIGDQGEIQSRGSGVMLEYWGEPEATKERFTADGWLRTGDQGEIEEDGTVRVLGRIDEVLVLPNGMKLYPVPLEQELQAALGVRYAIFHLHEEELELVVDAPHEISASVIWSYLVQQEQRDRLWPRVRRLCRLSEPLSIDNGGLTHKGTVRRRAVVKRLREERSKNKRGRDSYESRPPM